MGLPCNSKSNMKAFTQTSESSKREPEVDGVLT